MIASGKQFFPIPAAGRLQQSVVHREPLADIFRQNLGRPTAKLRAYAGLYAVSKGYNQFKIIVLYPILNLALKPKLCNIKTYGVYHLFDNLLSLDEYLRVSEENDYLQRIKSMPEKFTPEGYAKKLPAFGTLTVPHKTTRAARPLFFREFIPLPPMSLARGRRSAPLNR